MRETPSTVAPPKPTQIRTQWQKIDGMPQQLASEMLFSFVGGLVYVTFGQVNIPLPGSDGAPSGVAEIQPVAKLVFSPSAFHKFLNLWNSVSSQIPNDAESAEG